MEFKEAMPQLEKDPLETKESDYGVGLKQIPGYTLLSQSTFVAPDKDRVQISAKAVKIVKKFIAKLKDKVQ